MVFIRQGSEVSVRNIEMFVIPGVRYTESLLYIFDLSGCVKTTHFRRFLYTGYSLLIAR